MSIPVLAEVLQTLDKVGISEVVFEPDPDNADHTRLRGANKDQNVVIFDTIDEKLVEKPMGVQSVKGLLSRIMLFDLEKASMDFRSTDSEITDLNIKQGRKKASFRFASESSLGVPKKIPGGNNSDVIEFSQDYIKYLSNAISAMSYTGAKETRTLSISSHEEVLEVSVFDGESDSFVDHLDYTDVEDFDKGVWEVDPFKLVMTQSSSHDDEKAASFCVNLSHKYVIFKVGMVSVLVTPMM